VWGRMVTRNGSEALKLFRMVLEKPYVLSVIFSQPPNYTYD